MKRIEKLVISPYRWLLICAFTILISGCGSGSTGIIAGENPVFTPVKLGWSQAFSGIAAVKDSTNSRINIYVRVLDQFDDSLKLPGTFRIELYQKQQGNTSNPGQRLNINEVGYVDFDLTEPENNQKHWDRISGCYALSFTVDYAMPELQALVTWFYTPNYRLTTTIDLQKK